VPCSDFSVGLVFSFSTSTSIYIYFVCLSEYLFVNVKTAKPIWPIFGLGPHMTTGKVFG